MTPGEPNFDNKGPGEPSPETKPAIDYDETLKDPEAVAVLKQKIAEHEQKRLETADTSGDKGLIKTGSPRLTVIRLTLLIIITTIVAFVFWWLVYAVYFYLKI